MPDIGTALSIFSGAAPAAGDPAPAVAPSVAPAPAPVSDLQAKIGIFSGAAKAPDGAPAADASSDAPSFGDAVSNVAKNVGAGVNTAIADIAGAPVDAVVWLGNHGPSSLISGARPVDDMLGGKPAFGGSESIKQGMGLIGANPDDVSANNALDRVARGAGNAAASVVLPEAALGRVSGAWDAIKQGATGLIAGATGKTAAEVAPEPLKPVADVVGNVLGAGVGGLVTESPNLVRGTVQAARDYVAPLTEAGQQRLAGQTLADAASNPQTALEALRKPTEIVPGSQPTTFQATGDMGLGSLERASAANNPAAFSARAAEQNSARVGALGGIQADGQPEAVSAALRQHLADVDASTQTAVDQATNSARSATQSLGGTDTPEGYGAAVRGGIQTAETAARAHEGALWKAVDPDGTLATNMAPVQAAVQKVYGDLPKATEIDLSDDERKIADVISQYRPVEPFSQLAALRTKVSADLRKELSTNGRTPAYGRLTQLRGAIEDTLSGAVEHKAVQDQAAVQAGRMAPEDAIGAALQKEADVWKSGKVAGATSRTGTADAGTVRPTAFSGSYRAESASRGQLGLPSGNQSVQSDGLTANFDQAALDRLRAATQATKDRAQTFGVQPIKGVLKKSGQAGPYDKLDSLVPSQFFKAGPSGAEAVGALRKATGDQGALHVLQDFAASTLRKQAERPDGTLDPAKVASWRSIHADALRAFPELDRRFADAASASESIANVAAVRKDALDSFQKGAVGDLVGVRSPQDVTSIVGGIFGAKDRVALMRQLNAEVGSDPNAVQGLRKAVVEHITNKFLSNAEAGTTGQSAIKSDQFQTFLKNNQATLRQVFSEDEVRAMNAIGADLKRANRSITAVKLPGGSNTAQDTRGLAKHFGEAPTILTRILSHAAGVAGAGGGGLFGGPIGAAVGAVGGEALARFRASGIKTIGDLVEQAMLDPAKARALLEKVPASASKAASASLGQRFRAALVPGFGSLVNGRSAEAGAARMAENGAESSISQARLAPMIYDAPVKSGRPFSADYPNGAPADATGRISRDIDGRTLHAQYVVGRNMVGQPDANLSPAQFGSLTEAAIGRAPQGVPANALPRNSLGAYARNMTENGTDRMIAFDRSLPLPQAGRVVSHEIGHMIDDLAGRVPTKGLNTELTQNFSTLSTGQERTRHLTSPQNLGYSAKEAPQELMAEAIRAYLTNPNYLKTVAPKTAAAIRAAVNSHPTLSKIVQFNTLAGAAVLPAAIYANQQRQQPGNGA